MNNSVSITEISQQKAGETNVLLAELLRTCKIIITAVIITITRIIMKKSINTNAGPVLLPEC